MDELRITKKTEPVSFTIRIDRTIADFYDDMANRTNRSRNEIISIALEYAKERISVDEVKK